MISKAKLVLMVLVVLLTISAISTIVAAESVEDFYKGKTLQILVPHGAGGGFDTYARMFATFLEEYIPDSTVIVKNVTGAGGIIGRNEIWRSKADGLTLGLTGVPNMLFAEFSELPGVLYKTTEFIYLARITAEPRVMVVSAKSPYKSIEELQNAEKVQFAFSGVGSDDYYSALIIARALGINMEPITGYQGSNEANFAAIRGEVCGVQTSFGTCKPLIDNGDVVPVLQITGERYEGLPDVPTAIEITDGDTQKIVKAIVGTFAGDRVIFAPPGVASEKTEYLRVVLDKIFNDEEFLAHADKIGRTINYLEGSKMQKLVNDIAEASNLITPILKEIKELK